MQAHAVVLDLPAKLCANRATNRVDHEGGLTGPKAKQAVYRMGSQLAKAGPPQASEGLSSVMVRIRSCPTSRHSGVTLDRRQTSAYKKRMHFIVVIVMLVSSVQVLCDVCGKCLPHPVVPLC